MNVREYFKNKLSQPMSEDYEDLLTGKEVMDIAQECVDEALKQVKNHVVLDNVSGSFISDEGLRDIKFREFEKGFLDGLKLKQ